MRNKILLSLFSFAILSFCAVSSAGYATEATTVDGACTTGTSRADWDSLFQCVDGKWKRAAYRLGTTSDGCDAGHAGQLQWTGSAFKKCDGGGAWQDMGGGSNSGACDMGTSLLLHMDGAQGSSTITNSSIYSQIQYYNATLTNSGVTIDTGVSKFGGASGYFNGSSYLTTDYRLNCPHNDFTIDFWMYPVVIGVNSVLVGVMGDFNNNWWAISYGAANKLSYSGRTAGVMTSVTSTTTLAANTWYHVAVVRSGTTLSLYINGTLESTATMSSDPYCTSTSNPVLGYWGSYGQYYKGYIDEYRFSTLARWTSNFTPPTTAYTTCGSSGTATAYYGFQNPTSLVYGATPTSSILAFNGTTAQAVSVSGDGSPQLRINGGSWVTSGTISPGQTIQLQNGPLMANGTTYTTTLVTGTQTDTWKATTANKTLVWGVYNSGHGSVPSGPCQVGVSCSLTNTLSTDDTGWCGSWIRSTIQTYANSTAITSGAYNGCGGSSYSGTSLSPPAYSSIGVQ